MPSQIPSCCQVNEGSHQLEVGGEREGDESEVGYALFGLQTVQVTRAIALGSFNLSPAMLLLWLA